MSAVLAALETTAEPGLLQQTWAMWIGAALIAAALTIAVSVLLPNLIAESRRRRGKRSLDSDAPRQTASGSQRLTGMRDAATRFATRAVERTEASGRIDIALDRAGVVMRAGEFVALTAGITAAAALAGYLFFDVVGIAIGALVALGGAYAYLERRGRARNQAFADQLPDALTVLAGALRAGFGFAQAIESVAEELDAPLSTEFRRAILESRLGRDIEVALEGVAERVQSEDLTWVIEAVRINQQVGGDLARIFDQVAETIRSRNRLKRQVSALTAEGRVSAVVLGLLPVVMGGFLYATNPDYLEPMFSRTMGLVALGVAAALLATGALWLKKMIDLDY